MVLKDVSLVYLLLTFTCSKSVLETLEKAVKYVQSSQQEHHNDVVDAVLIFSLFYCYLVNVSWILTISHLSLLPDIPLSNFKDMNLYNSAVDGVFIWIPFRKWFLGVNADLAVLWVLLLIWSKQENWMNFWQ